MYTKEALLDLHDRAHRSLRKLLTHCTQLSADSLDRKLEGFGYPTVRLQLHHAIGAEEYWTGVLQGKILADDNDAEFPTVAALEAYRERVAGVTRAYLEMTPAAELNTAREMVTWQGAKRRLVPALVVLRPLTHIYQHQGQVLAMGRLLGMSGPDGLDFPID
jgi:uncharacterized damage-inducible protein DinB